MEEPISPTANLGLATTRQLVQEIIARIEMRNWQNEQEIHSDLSAFMIRLESKPSLNATTVEELG